ncbi:MAG TPA: zf-HC2 domain-containing protein, partial [Caulifigura sp.]|nr:zf-HC2 domain-containing protein [Caulifigura sp.]
MPLSPPPCDPRRASRFLDGSLSDAEQAAFETHLETCAVCRETLESGAGDRQAWSQVREYLSSIGPGEDLTRDALQEIAETADHN